MNTKNRQAFMIYRQEYLNPNTNQWYKKMIFLDYDKAVNFVQCANKNQKFQFSLCRINIG